MLSNRTSRSTADESVDTFGRRGEPACNVSAGRDTIGAGDGQVRPERPIVGRPAGRDQLPVQRPSERGELRSSVRQGEPQGPGPARVRKRSPAVDPDFERVLGRRDTSDRLGHGRDVGFGRWTEEAQREVQAVHAHPADIAFVGGVPSAVGADLLHERHHGLHRGLVQGHRHEQAALGHRVRAPTSRSHASRSACRISKARA